MQIQIEDNTRNGEVFVRNNTAQKQVERQLNDILATITETNEKLRELQ